MVDKETKSYPEDAGNVEDVTNELVAVVLQLILGEDSGVFLGGVSELGPSFSSLILVSSCSASIVCSSY